MLETIESWSVSKRAVSGSGGAVASQHRLASEAGAEILELGGNAIDAAVACAFALNACEPWMSGLGGSGCAVVWSADEKRAQAIDFQGVLAAGIDIADYPLDSSVPDVVMGFPGVKDNRTVVGYSAITVPGAVRGLAELHQRYGKLGFDTVLGPAIRLAEGGLPVDWHTTLMIALAMKELHHDKLASAIFLPDGCPPEPPARRPLPLLATTLKRLAEAGPDDFYSGQLAQSIARDLQAGGSPIDIEDLASYQAVWLTPLVATYRGAQLHTAGATSGGPRLVDFLAHVEANLDLDQGLGPHSWKTYADGLDFAWKNHRHKIGLTPPVRGCTTHLSACDAAGNMVALTNTLMDRFGAQLVLPETGILMNNSVSYFDPRPGHSTSIEGSKRINASNMSPTVCVRNGQAYFALGASGANRIFPATAQLAALLLDHELSLEEAFHVPRIDCLGIGSVQVDSRMEDAVKEEISKFYDLEIAELAVFPKLYACPQGVMHKNGMCHGISDPSHPIGGAAAV